jgi:membrane dipeptidase
VAAGKVAVLLSIESGFDQEGDIDVLRLWHRLGVRFIQFAGQVTTAYADSAVRGEAKWGGINERGRRLIAEMNRLGMVIDITHATEAGQRQIIAASRAPVIASHVAMRAVCDNPSNMQDDILRALAAKGGVVGIHAFAGVVGQKYFDWSRTHPANAGLAYALLDAPNAEPRLVRQRPGDAAEYVDALDKRLGMLWRDFYAEPWRDDPAALSLVPSMDDWVNHVAHVIDIVGPSHIGIGLDLTQGRSVLKDFDARNYNELKNTLTKRNVPASVFGENWLRVLDAARVN